MRPRRAAAIALALLAVVLVGAVAAFGGGPRGDDRAAVPAAAPRPTPGAGDLRRTPPQARTEPVKRVVAVVRRRTLLRRSPNGPRLGTIALRTRFGSRQRLAVVSRRGSWLGVLHPNARAGRAGWIPRDAVREEPIAWEIALDRSAQVVRVRRDGRVVRRFKVAVGRAASPTPLGRYAITDRIKPEAGSVYGCCILALSARQKNLPPGWTGGDRIALHGSPADSVGGTVSAGCVRMKRKALRWLLRNVPDGTRLDVVS